jgi:hypothetical protein
MAGYFHLNLLILPNIVPLATPTPTPKAQTHPDHPHPSLDPSAAQQQLSSLQQVLLLQPQHPRPIRLEDTPVYLSFSAQTERSIERTEG